MDPRQLHAGMTTDGVIPDISYQETFGIFRSEGSRLMICGKVQSGVRGKIRGEVVGEGLRRMNTIRLSPDENSLDSWRLVRASC